MFRLKDNVSPHPGLQRFASLAPKARTPGTNSTVKPFNLSFLLPTTLWSVYAYHEYMPNPPCGINIRWIVAAEPQIISTKIVNISFYFQMSFPNQVLILLFTFYFFQINTFRSVVLANNATNNVRHPLPKNGRVVQYYNNYIPAACLPRS